MRTQWHSEWFRIILKSKVVSFSLSCKQILSNTVKDTPPKCYIQKSFIGHRVVTDVSIFVTYLSLEDSCTLHSFGNHRLTFIVCNICVFTTTGSVKIRLAINPVVRSTTICELELIADRTITVCGFRGATEYYQDIALIISVRNFS